MLTIREYKQAATLEEAWQLNQKRPNRVLGGMLWMRLSKGNVQTAIDLSALGLDTIEETETEFRIGAMVSLRQLELHKGFTAYSEGANKRISKTDFPVLTCAAALTQEGVQVAVGARPAKAALVKDAEQLATLPMTAEKAQAFAEYAADLLSTESNPRGSAAYRTHLIKVLTARCLTELGGKA